jgi:hypothetical protein
MGLLLAPLFIVGLFVLTVLAGCAQTKNMPKSRGVEQVHYHDDHYRYEPDDDAVVDAR